MKLEIEIFRILSAFGIVWFHSGVVIGRDIAYGGLIFFVTISTYFAANSLQSHTLVERFNRLIVPFFIWGIGYGVILFIDNGVFFPENYTLFSMILASPSIHLWFLPFIFAVLVLVDKLRPIILTELVITAIGILSIFLIMSAPFWREFDYIPPFAQYAHALPAVLIGIFLGAIDNVRFKSVIILGISISIFIMIYRQQAGVGVAYLSGLIPCCFLFLGRFSLGKRSLIYRISSATFGVYLFHIFVLNVLILGGLSGVLLPIIGFFVSLFFVMIFREYAPKSIVRLLM